MPSRSDHPSGLNRRQFLLTTGAAALALALRPSLAWSAGEPVFAESSCPQAAQAGPRVLVTYASRCGSTGEIAQALAGVLCAQGATVDVRLIGHAGDLGQYQAVLVGSAIRAGKWLPEAKDFVKAHQETLAKLPTAFFVACLTMREDSPANRAKVLAYLDPVHKAAPQVRPRAVGLFAGAVDFGKLPFVQRTVLEAKGSPEGDFRDFPAIKSWAGQTAPGLLAARTQG